MEITNNLKQQHDFIYHKSYHYHNINRHIIVCFPQYCAATQKMKLYKVLKKVLILHIYFFLAIV